MLVIKHYFGAIFIPKGKEFCIYDEAFPIDEKGKRVTEGPGSWVDLDVIIETQDKRYRFQEVSADYAWARRLSDYLAEHVGEDLTVDINEILDSRFGVS